MFVLFCTVCFVQCVLYCVFCTVCFVLCVFMYHLSYNVVHQCIVVVHKLD